MLHAYRKAGGVAVPVALGVPPSVTPANVVSSTQLMSSEQLRQMRLRTGCNAKRRMKGVNLGNFFEVAWEGQNSSDWSKAKRVVRMCIEAGFDHVRLPIRWTSHMASTADGTIDPAFLAVVREVVDEIMLAGLVCIVNFHHYRQLEGDALNVSGQLGDPQNVLTADVRPRIANGWTQVATAFKGYGDALIFELYNEAHNLLDETDTNQQATRWSLFYPSLAAAIRAVDTTRIMMLGGSNYNNTDGLNWMAVPDMDLGPWDITYHNYLPPEHTHQGWDGRPTGVLMQPSDRIRMRASDVSARLWAESLGLTAHCGEFGCVDLAEDQVASIAVRRREIELAGNGWCIWMDWLNPTSGGFGLLTPDLQWKPGVLDALFAPGEPAGAPAIPANILTIPTSQAWAQWGGSQQPTVAASGRVTWPTATSRSSVAGVIAPPVALAAGQRWLFANIGLGNCRYTLGVRRKGDPGAVYDLSAGFVYPGQTMVFTVPAFAAGNDAMATWQLTIQAESATAGPAHFTPYVCILQ